MTSTFESKFSLSVADSEIFARLSGDWNPLHVDPIAARRIRFGGTVVHGIHLYLRALDELSAQGMLDQLEPASLTATFDSPVATGSVVVMRVSTDMNRIRISGETTGRRAFTGSIELRPRGGGEPEADDSEFLPTRPRDVDFPPAFIEGSVPLKLSSSLLAALFPSLASQSGRLWIADLLATTQIIGMSCPGMHSIYSGFKLRLAAGSGGLATSMHYQINGMERRFHLLRMQVAGARLEGTIEAFFRARPVPQRPLREVAEAISPDLFAGHRVLVVGGSRGLGELSAKIAAAAGAKVTITYAHGKDDADLICDEARALGLACTARQFDVLREDTQSDSAWLSRSGFSHVYFFASPPISRNAGQWSESLFQLFTRVYVSAFANVVEHTLPPRSAQSSVVRYLYPSSVFVTQPETGFAEYSVAKAAGEALCDQLQGRPGAHFVKPRLPRMLTDQTSSLVSIGAADPFPIMLDLARSFHT
jgi:acyl dehydratase/NADP-dependent 3-hydroxy acid dehydrogenase YdfG